MTTQTHLIRSRRFLPLFVTQLLNAFNDNLFKNAMVLFVVYSVYNSKPKGSSARWHRHFLSYCSSCFPCWRAAGRHARQGADHPHRQGLRNRHHAGRRRGTGAGVEEIAVHTLAIPLMLAALFAMGVHSTFFGLDQYAIRPAPAFNEVLAGTGLVEAGTYIAILAGTMIAGWIEVEWAALGVVLTALLGYGVSREVPPAPAQGKVEPLTRITCCGPDRAWSATPATTGACSWRSWRSASSGPSARCCSSSSRCLPKNVLSASKEVASLFLVIFSIGVAIGSMSVNALLKGTVSARYLRPYRCWSWRCSSASTWWCQAWPAPDARGPLDVASFVAEPLPCRCC